MSNWHREKFPGTRKNIDVSVKSRIDANIVDCERDGEICGSLRRSRPSAADRQIDDQLRWAGRRSVRTYPRERTVCHKAVVDEMFDDKRSPFDRKLVEAFGKIEPRIIPVMAIEHRVVSVADLAMQGMKAPPCCISPIIDDFDDIDLGRARASCGIQPKRYPSSTNLRHLHPRLKIPELLVVSAA